MAYVRVRHAVKFFPREDGSNMLVLDRVSFESKDYGITSLLGPSGCGKSTLLNIVTGLEKLDDGEVDIVSDDPGAAKTHPALGYVFQDPRLLNWKRVEDNLKFALRGMQVPSDEWEERLEKYLELVGLSEFRRQYPLYLSGGMRQRVGLARGLVIEPQVLLMDEPYSKLDQLTARKLREDTLDICAKMRQSALLVTHDVEESAYMGDRIIILSARPARIAAIYENPLRPSERDTDGLRFIEFKKEVLSKILSLVKEET